VLLSGQAHICAQVSYNIRLHLPSQVSHVSQCLCQPAVGEHQQGVVEAMAVRLKANHSRMPYEQRCVPEVVLWRITMQSRCLHGQARVVWATWPLKVNHQVDLQSRCLASRRQVPRLRWCLASDSHLAQALLAELLPGRHLGLAVATRLVRLPEVWQMQPERQAH